MEKTVYELQDEISILQSKIKKLEGQMTVANSTAEKARAMSKEMQELANKQYQKEVDKLSIFRSRFDIFMTMLEDELVTEDVKVRRNNLKLMLKAIFNGSYSQDFNIPDKQIIADTSQILKNNNIRSKNSTVMFGQGENAFSLDDIMYPKETLDLKSLCSELGLMED